MMFFNESLHIHRTGTYIYVGNEKCGPLEDHSKFRQSADYLSRKSSEETRKVDGSWWFCYTSWEKQYTSC